MATGRYAKSLIFTIGGGRAYLDGWWRRRVRHYPPLTDWNHHHRAIFVHVPKTAGTSLYTALQMPQPAETHCPATGFRAADAKAWRDYFTFAFVRHPLDRLVSAYHYLIQAPLSEDDRRWARSALSGFADFTTFVYALKRPLIRAKILSWRHFTPQWYFVCDASGDVMVDRLCRYENLGTEVGGLAERLGISATLDHENKARRGVWQDAYTLETKAIAADVYARDLALFGYGNSDGT